MEIFLCFSVNLSKSHPKYSLKEEIQDNKLLDLFIFYFYFILFSP